MMRTNEINIRDPFVLAYEGKIDPNDAVSKETLCPDGLHPNAAGHILIKDCLIDFLKALEEK